MKRLRIILAIIAAVSLAAGHLLRNDRRPDEHAALASIAPGVQFLEKTGSPPRYPSGSGLTAFNSYDVTTTVLGYAGPIKVMIALERDGVIRGLAILEHSETMNYVHYMESREYLDRYVGKSVHDTFEVDRDIDGITRATISVDALARTVRDSSRTVAQEVLGIPVTSTKTAGGAGTGWMWYLLLFTGATAGYFITRATPSALRVRDLCLVACIVVVGLVLSSPFSILHAFNFAMLRPAASLLWYVIVAGTLLSAAAAGRFYCGWLCPFGAISEFLGRLPVRKWIIPPALDDRWRKVKYYLLGVSIPAVFLTGRAEYGNYEAYVTLFSLHGSMPAWALVAFSLLANLRIKRFWCRVLCPVAALTGLLARKAYGYPSRQDCPMANRTNPQMSECIRCNQCFQPPGGAASHEEKPLHNRVAMLDNKTV